MNQDDDMDDEGWGDYDNEDEQVDADDTAWKVRKSAVKVIDAVIVSCPAHLREFWISYVELLQSRFIERDDNVKCDILQTFQNLIKASVVVDQSAASSDMHAPSLIKQNSKAPKLQLEKQRSFAVDVVGHYDKIVKQLLKQYSSKNIKVKIAVIKTLSVVALIMQDELERHLASIIPIIYQSLGDNNNDILTYSLSILQQGFRSTNPQSVSQVAQKECEQISKFLLSTMSHN